MRVKNNFIYEGKQPRSHRNRNEQIWRALLQVWQTQGKRSCSKRTRRNTTEGGKYPRLYNRETDRTKSREQTKKNRKKEHRRVLVVVLFETQGRFERLNRGGKGVQDHRNAQKRTRGERERR